MINIDGEEASNYFLPIQFEERSKDGKKKDLMAAFESGTKYKTLEAKNKMGPLQPIKDASDKLINLPDAQKSTVQKHFTSAMPGSQIAKKVTD